MCPVAATNVIHRSEILYRRHGADGRSAWEASRPRHSPIEDRRARKHGERERPADDPTSTSGGDEAKKWQYELTGVQHGRRRDRGDGRRNRDRHAGWMTSSERDRKSVG